MDKKIDFVVTWVDDQDPEWLAEREKYQQIDSGDKKSNGAERYRDPGFFNYWFRAIEEYAPWVNKVFFITYGHVPDWLNVAHPKLKIVKHSDYIPEEYLPTYNSNVIELNLHRIDELSDHFVLFNDDFFLNKPVLPEDFFEEELPKEFGIYRPILADGPLAHTLVNNARVINKHFKAGQAIKAYPSKFFTLKYGKHNLNNLFSLLFPRIMGYHSAHITAPMLKQTFKEVWREEPDLLNKVSMNRFRTKDDISQYLMSNWNIEKGQFVPQDSGFGCSYQLDQIELIESDLLKQKSCVICINDSENVANFEEAIVGLKRIFEKKLPQKSTYEI